MTSNVVPLLSINCLEVGVLCVFLFQRAASFDCGIPLDIQFNLIHNIRPATFTLRDFHFLKLHKNRKLKKTCH